MAFNSILPLLHTNCSVCGQTVHDIGGNSRTLRSHQLHAPLVTAQNDLVSKELTGGVVYRPTQFGPPKPILHKDTSYTDYVPIKISKEDPEKNCELFQYLNEVSMHSQSSQNPMNLLTSCPKFSDSETNHRQCTSQVTFTPHFHILSCSGGCLSAPSVQCQHLDVPRDHAPCNEQFCFGQADRVQERIFKPNKQGEGKYNNLLNGKEICHTIYHVFVHHRDYYIALKENSMGMFVRMIEIDPCLNPRSPILGKIFMRIHSVFELRSYLDKFFKFFNTLNVNPCKPNDISVLQGHPIKSEVIFSSTRRYYLDLVTNKKGSCLKIKQTTIPNGPCSSLVIGAAGLKHFYEAITDMLTRFVTRGSLIRSLPQRLHVNGVKEFDSFYFDVGQNEAGVYLRISKTGKDKSVITVPMESWTSFHDLFDSYIVKMKDFRDMQAYQ